MSSVAEIILEKVPLPTALASAEVKAGIAQAIREQAFYSARMAQLDYLKELQRVCTAFADGKVNAAEARTRCQTMLDELDLSDHTHQLTDHGSARRLNLILETQRKMAGSMAQRDASKDPEVLERFPAWELVSGGWRRVHRTDWHKRWKAAGEACGWQGASRTRMAALKTSPIWEHLGNGVGGFKDTLGNPYPPFAYGSSYEWDELSIVEAQNYGLLATPDGVVGNKQTDLVAPYGAPHKRIKRLLTESQALQVENAETPRCPDCQKFCTPSGDHDGPCAGDGQSSAGTDSPSKDGNAPAREETTEEAEATKAPEPPEVPARRPSPRPERSPRSKYKPTSVLSDQELIKAETFITEWQESPIKKDPETGRYPRRRTLNDFENSQYDAKVFLLSNPSTKDKYGKPIHWPEDLYGKYFEGFGRKGGERPARLKYTRAAVWVAKTANAKPHVDNQTVYQHEFKDDNRVVAVIINNTSRCVNGYMEGTPESVESSLKHSREDQPHFRNKKKSDAQLRIRRKQGEPYWGELHPWWASCLTRLTLQGTPSLNHL